jgi:hypothetical protein
MHHLFLDESGNHSLNAYEPSYPVFVLGGVLVGEHQLARLAAAVRAFKIGFFGHDRLVLHTADIARNRRGFEQLADPGVRRRFYAELNALVRRLDFSVIACAIDKPLLVQRYGALAVDPYALSLGIVVERLCFALGASEQGRIIVECRNRRLDRELRTSWDILRINGTRFVRPAAWAGASRRRRVAARTSGGGNARPPGYPDRRRQTAHWARRWLGGRRSGRSAQRKRPGTATQYPTKASVGSTRRRVKAGGG